MKEATLVLPPPSEAHGALGDWESWLEKLKFYSHLTLGQFNVNKMSLTFLSINCDYLVLILSSAKLFNISALGWSANETSLLAITIGTKEL